MTKFTIVIATLFITCSCSKKIVGTYEHTACCMGMGCQIIHLREDNRYEYISWGDIVGVDTVKGYYKISHKSLTLNPILPFEYEKQTGFVKEMKSKPVDSVTIGFYALPAVLKKVNNDIYRKNEYSTFTKYLNKKDTLRAFTEFKINEKNYLSDTSGTSKVVLKINDTITVYEPFSDKQPLFSYIISDIGIESMDIYYPTNGYNPYYYRKEYTIKKDRLLPVDEGFVTDCMVKKTDNYRCIDYTERKIIRDSVFSLIQRNINRKTLLDGYYDDFYIVFNYNGKVKKVIIHPELLGDIYLLDNISSFKLRSSIKKSIKGYKIPLFDKINYNLMIRLVIDYDEDSDNLELIYF
jgi:hypothetical protein